MTLKRARRILERYKNMKSEKQPWLPLYQLCAEYVMSRKQQFINTVTPGQILTDQIYDDVAPWANQQMASTIIGAMWPNGAKSFRWTMPFELEDADLGGDTEAVKNYYQWATKRTTKFLDNPKSGWATSLEEYMLDQGAFGISGRLMTEQDDPEVPLLYSALDAKALHIDEGLNGFVDTIYIYKTMTIRQLVAEYGLENVNKEHREAFVKGEQPDEKVEVLQAIEPRMDADPTRFGVKNFPIASIHIDIKNEKILRESGFREMPAAITRFWKAMNEKYGRCPAMSGMPTILEANAVGEAWSIAVEKTLDPSLLVLDDGSMGNGVIDTSPGGITVVSVSGRIGNQKPIEPLFLVGDLQWTAARREQLETLIKQHFNIDLLTDFNSDQRMQNPEVMARLDIRGQTLNTTYTRQFGEHFVPMLENSGKSLLRRGYLGVVEGSPEHEELLEQGASPKIIPEPIASLVRAGRFPFRLEFISPAARQIQAEELKGIEHLLTTTINVGQAQPSVLDNIDWDWTVRRIQELDGAPDETILALDKIKKIRDDRIAMQQAQMELEANRAQSETARNMGQAAASVGMDGAA